MPTTKKGKKKNMHYRQSQVNVIEAIPPLRVPLLKDVKLASEASYDNL